MDPWHVRIRPADEPAVGTCLFDAEFGHSHGFPPFPVDEDAICKLGP